MAPVSDLTRFICLFHSADRANAAVNALEQAGIVRNTISTFGDEGASTSESVDLSDIGVPARDLQHLQDGLRRGGIVVSLEAAEGRTDAIEKIFHHYSADKIDETELPPAAYVAPVETAAAVPAYGAAQGSAVDETVIPVAEESLLVGKREVDRGGVRVYQRTVETPAQQQISLHDERVMVERHEVNRPVTEADLRSGDQSIELVETSEVPVVQKIARVVEEVRVGKVESDRTEVIHDTVRHTEVEVESMDTPSDTNRRI